MRSERRPLLLLPILFWSELLQEKLSTWTDLTNACIHALSD